MGQYRAQIPQAGKEASKLGLELSLGKRGSYWQVFLWETARGPGGEAWKWTGRCIYIPLFAVKFVRRAQARYPSSDARADILTSGIELPELQVLYRRIA